MVAQRKLLVIAFAAASLALPLTSQARVDLDINIAPPAPRYEAVPPPRVGFVWAPGFWAWDNGHHRHIWRTGHYVRERRGQHWVPDRWAEHGGRYRYEAGRWER